MTLRSWVVLITGGTVLALGLALFLDHRKIFLPGKTSDGHHLFETSCNSCHVPFASVPNANCIGCHKPVLREDTHTGKIFDDPRWAATLENIDALHCISCHKEHLVAERGVTVGRDFCFPCHDDVVVKRASHRAFKPDSCWDAGCHNYHDNTALNVSFLKQRLGHEPIRPQPEVLNRRAKTDPSKDHPIPHYPAELTMRREIQAAWEKSLHAKRDVNCLDCHKGEKEAFVLSPAEKTCARCHGFEVETFHQGKHGVKASLKLSPLTPAEARVPMKSRKPEDRKLTCSTCHDPHSVDTQKAAVEACLGCHNDPHSKSFFRSKHFALFAADQGPRPGPRAVTCATCHLPKVKVQAKGGTRVAVNHNNTFTLQPRDRMVKEVCLSCHGLEFAMTSIFDDRLILNNFQGGPERKHETLKMVEAFQEEEKAKPQGGAR